MKNTLHIVLLVLFISLVSASIILPIQTTKQTAQPIQKQNQISLNPASPLQTISPKPHCTKPKLLIQNVSAGLTFQDRYLFYTAPISQTKTGLFVYDFGPDKLPNTKDDIGAKMIDSLKKEYSVFLFLDISKDPNDNQPLIAYLLPLQPMASYGNIKIIKSGKDGLFKTSDDLVFTAYSGPTSTYSAPSVKDNIISFKTRGQYGPIAYWCDVNKTNALGECSQKNIQEIKLGMDIGKIIPYQGSFLFEKRNQSTKVIDILLKTKNGLFTKQKGRLNKKLSLSGKFAKNFYLFIEESHNNGFKKSLKVSILPGKATSEIEIASIFSKSFIPNPFINVRGATNPHQKTNDLLIGWEKILTKLGSSTKMGIEITTLNRKWTETVGSATTSLVGLDRNTVVIQDIGPNNQQALYTLQCE